jgi:hypothetical protein
MYSIYQERAHDEEEVQKQIDDAIVILQKLGRAPTDIGIF